jgi:hypothetical protein
MLYRVRGGIEKKKKKKKKKKKGNENSIVKIAER